MGDWQEESLHDTHVPIHTSTHTHTHYACANLTNYSNHFIMHPKLYVVNLMYGTVAHSVINISGFSELLSLGLTLTESCSTIRAWDSNRDQHAGFTYITVATQHFKLRSLQICFLDIFQTTVALDSFLVCGNLSAPPQWCLSFICVVWVPVSEKTSACLF